MHLRFKNVNDAFDGIVRGFHDGDFPMDVTASRNGEVISCSEPMTITYEQPLERVLFNQARDCNPFFHLFESLWMIAGRNDVKSLDYYNSQMKNYSDDGKTFNGAYGYRWRKYQETYETEVENLGDYTRQVTAYKNVDQLKILIDHLKANPFSRRAVLSMWNVEDDLLKIDSSKDVACNLCVKFRVGLGMCPACSEWWLPGKIYSEKSAKLQAQRTGNPETLCTKCNGTPHDQPRYLNMTVFNRSNDAIWGMLGANVVHFSFLQEYMAAHLGLEVGEYHQVADDLHVYTEKFEPEKWLPKHRTMHDPKPISYDGMKLVPLVEDPKRFDEEVGLFVDNIDRTFSEPFFRFVAQPMCCAFRRHKDRDYEGALYWLGSVKAHDWRTAGFNWIKKRQRMWEDKHDRETKAT